MRWIVSRIRLDSDFMGEWRCDVAWVLRFIESPWWSLRSSLCQPLQGLQKIELFFLHLRAVPTQRCVQFTSLDVTPDLSSNRFCSGNRHRIIPTAQAIDPLVFSINPPPDHDAAVIPPQRRPFPQDPAPPLSSGLSAPPPQANNPSEPSKTPLVGSRFGSLTLS